MRTLTLLLAFIITFAASAEDLGKKYADQAWDMYNRLESGKTVDGDSYPAIIELFNQAADYGKTDVYNTIGYIYQHHAPIVIDNHSMSGKEYAALIESYYNKAIASGSHNAIYNLATCYHRPDSRTGFERDMNKAVALYRMGANAGNAFCLTELGLLYKDRYIRSAESYPEVAAFECFRKAYENQPRNCPAICPLAECYETGQGVARDEAKAFDLYLEGSDYNDYAAAKVGLFYEEGRVVEKNLQKAYEFYEKATANAFLDQWIIEHHHHVGYQLGKEETPHYMETETVSAAVEPRSESLD